MTDVRETGFKEVTRVSEARRRLREAIRPLDRTETQPASTAEGRILAEAVDAARNVPHFARAAMDGYAVRAADTFDATDRAPATLRETTEAVGPGEAVRVHTGSQLPSGADAVIQVEHTERRADPGAEDAHEVDVFEAVGEGANVAPIGEDVTADQRLFEAGHQLRPSDLGLLRAAGVGTVDVYHRPTVAVLPTGNELVGGGDLMESTSPGTPTLPEPAPGEVVETNGGTVARYVQRWGGIPTYREVIPDEAETIRAAIERDLTKDIIVTTGGSSVGERDVVPEVVDGLGEILVHGVGVRPGHPLALGVVHGTPVVLLPGYPVACIVNAVQFLRPALKWSGRLPLRPHPTTTARLARKVPSEPGRRTFVRVSLDTADGETIATPTRAAGAGVLSSVALADGWVVVPEDREGLDADETVTVEDWEWSP